MNEDVNVDGDGFERLETMAIATARTNPTTSYGATRMTKLRLVARHLPLATVALATTSAPRNSEYGAPQERKSLAHRRRTWARGATRDQ